MTSTSSSVPETQTLLLPNLEALATTANSYASSHGLMVEKPAGQFQAAPMSLLPNIFPASAFDQAVHLAPLWNVLVDRISRDATFLEATLGGDVAAADPFTAQLLRLYGDLYRDPSSVANQADRFNIHRSDYMLHPIHSRGDSEEDPSAVVGVRYSLKQIELNTIATSFASLACQTAQLHAFLTSRFDCDKFLEQNRQKVSKSSGSSEEATPRGVPTNPTLERLPLAMSYAVARYVERFAPTRPPVVLFVVQPGETNTVDQRLLEFALFERHGICAVRLSLAECLEQVRRSPDGALLLYDDGNDDGDSVTEIALVYYRAGYAPTDYPSGPDGAEWRARALLEDSRATKAPSLGYHLAGTKKVQQALARPGAVELFFETSPSSSSSPEAVALRECFAGLWSLGQDANVVDLAAVRRVLQGGHANYVLKPQREGGGYNFYGEQLARKLREHVQIEEDGDGDGDDSTATPHLRLDATLGEYILMERLFPPSQTSILLRGGKIEGAGETVSELGCYGTILVSHDGKDVLHNEYAGFLLRTKFEGVDEGGVASGFATLSSPYLV